MSTEEGTTTQEASGAEARIRQLVARVKELESRVTELTPLAESAEKWRAQVDEVKAASKAEREALRIEREIAAAGITDAEGMEYVQHAYGKLPSEGRPVLSEWLAAKDSLPKAVRAYLPEATPTQATPTTTTMPRANAGVASQQPSVAPSAWSEAAIAKMTPAEFKANKAAIMASLLTP